MYINYLHFKEIDSTHAHAMAHLADCSDVHWTAISADTQHAGKGQGANKWQDVPGKAVLLTVVSPVIQLNAEAVFPRHWAAAVVALETLQPFTSAPIRLKWPNDLYLEGKKLGGLLTEGQWSGERCKRVVFSLGVNVLEAPEGFACLDTVVDLVALRKHLAEAVVGAWTEEDGQSQDAYLSHWLHEGLEEWQDEAGSFRAKAMDVDAFGRIGLQREGQEDVQWYLHGQVKWLGKG